MDMTKAMSECGCKRPQRTMAISSFFSESTMVRISKEGSRG